MRVLTTDELKTLHDPMATADCPAAPKRVNIIFHGLMAFRDLDANYYEVLLPKTDPKCPHETKYGNPCRGTLQRFPHTGGNEGPGPSYFTFEGILPEPPQRRSFPSATNGLVIKNSLVNPQYENVQVAIRVPKPFIIRHYRGGESHLCQLACNHATQAVLQRNPDVIHEVTVFSYCAFFRPRFVGPGVDYPIPHSDFQKPVLNIGIYCQPTGDCSTSDGKDFSKMFKLNQPPAPGDAFEINLNATSEVNGPRVDDWPPLRTSVGISFAEFLALGELDLPFFQLICRIMGCPIHGSNDGAAVAEIDYRTLGDFGPFGAIPGGCGPGFLCDDGL